ncbi:hypothetical protein CFIMG_004435RAa [Ceratocystis fimbriata CBS 114723]|uniref:Uncharacterized protein n=1 Tax=Ceratocystis fimbriata CBS 114723 TaxID=1035309 RepID=A0A2C5WZ41_9PEZI|nr:hypothetical protein CFIMG_004435RAa [Ceratocystis fimbriata CBS 114723]
MHLSLRTAFVSLLTLANAASLERPGAAINRRSPAIEARQSQGVNANRPVPTGACCVANTSLKQDVCSVNGQSGRCVPASVNNCGSVLTCIEDNRLTCDPQVLERGRPLCRLANGA